MAGPGITVADVVLSARRSLTDVFSLRGWGLHAFDGFNAELRRDQGIFSESLVDSWPQRLRAGDVNELGLGLNLKYGRRPVWISPEWG